MSNTNCLAGLQCPNCGSFGPYQIAAKCFAEVTDDGVQDTADFEWEGNSWCRCVVCSFQKKVKDFEPKRKTSGNPKGGKKRG